MRNWPIKKIAWGFCLEGWSGLELTVFISDKKVKARNDRNRNCIFSFPRESKGSHIGSFILCFTYPSYLPLQTDTYIDELLEIFLKLSMKTVQVHLIIWMTLVLTDPRLAD